MKKFPSPSLSNVRRLKELDVRRRKKKSIFFQLFFDIVLKTTRQDEQIGVSK